MRRDLDKLFDDYRSKGDVKALSKVFDRTARELLTLAHHMVRNLDDAEDLVQTTFVTAIDRAHTYDAQRPFWPWLTGILANSAMNLNRSRRQHADEAEVQVADGAPDPTQFAEHAELEQGLDVALGKVGKRYRQVLEPYLRQGRRPEEIARTLGLAPGTVRTQIHRGLTRLRQLLPAGVGAGVLVSSVRGLEVVRDAVLEHATATTAGVAAGATASSTLATSPLVFGGILVGKKLIGALTLVSLACIGGWYASSPALVAEDREVALEVERTRTEVELPHRPSALTIRPDEEGATASHDERESVAAEREEIRKGRLLARGRIHGVRPEHIAGVALSLQPTTLDDTVPTLGSVPIISEVASSFAGTTINRFGGSESRGASVVDAVSFGAYVQDEPRLEDGSQTSPPVPEYAAADVSRLTLPADIPVELSADGSYEADLTRALSPALDAGLESLFEALMVSGQHELYFTASETAACPEGILAALENGEDVVIEQDLELKPAALLRGKVASEPARVVDFQLAGALESEADVPPATLRVLEVLTERVVVNLTPADGESAGQRLYYSLTTLSGKKAGIFRFGESSPFAEADVQFDGGFELKVPEEGVFALVLVEGERQPVTRQVDLAFCEVLELEDPIELPVGPALNGVVETFGALQARGIELEASRIGVAGEKTFRWHQNELSWSNGQIVRARAQVTTKEDATFDFAGLSQGSYRLSLSTTNPNSLFSPEDIESGAVTLRLPSNEVLFDVSLSALDVELIWPDGDPEIEFPELIVENPETNEVLGRQLVPEGGRARLICRPNMPLRVRVKSMAFAFEGFEGKAPELGDVEQVELRGEPLPSDG